MARVSGRAVEYFVSVFKYFHQQRWRTVERRLIRFSPIAALNDPFEFKLSAKEIVKEVSQAVTERLGPEYVTHLLGALSQKSRLLPLGQFLDAGSNFVAGQGAKIKQEFVSVVGEANLKMRVLCLSQVAPDDKNSMLLWSHYTDGHRGLVLEFDEAHPWINYQCPKDRNGKYAGLVAYQETRPVHDGKEGGAFVFKKSTLWSYESEYRILRFLDTADDLNTSPVDALVEFPASCLISVTLGANCCPSIEAKLKTALLVGELKHVRLFRAELDTDEYLLKKRQVAGPC